LTKMIFAKQNPKVTKTILQKGCQCKGGSVNSDFGCRISGQALRSGADFDFLKRFFGGSVGLLCNLRKWQESSDILRRVGQTGGDVFCVGAIIFNSLLNSIETLSLLQA